MKRLILSFDTFFQMLPELIQSGVTFEAKEITGGCIEVIFTGGY